MAEKRQTGLRDRKRNTGKAAGNRPFMLVTLVLLLALIIATGIRSRPHGHRHRL